MRCAAPTISSKSRGSRRERTVALCASAAHQPFGGLRAFLLELSSKADIARPVIVDGRSRERYPSAVWAIVTRPISTPIQSSTLRLFLVWNVNGRKEKPFFVPVNQIGLARLEGEQFPVVVAANERDLLTTGQCPNAGKALVHVPRQDAEIIRDRAMLSELATNLVVNLVSVGNLGVESNNDLRRQWELVPNGSVKRFVRDRT